MTRTDPDLVPPPANNGDGPLAPPAPDALRATRSADGHRAVPAEPVQEPTPPAQEPRPPRDPDEGLKGAGILLQLGLAAVVLAAGFGITWFLITSKTAPARLPPVTSAPVVEVAVAEVGEVRATIEGFGRLQAAREVQVVPQVGGRVTATHPDLRPGGTLQAGGVVIEIDATDYELALEQRQAELARAEAALQRIEAARRAASAEVARRETGLETIRAEAAVARAEYERLNPDRDVPPLVAREPQLREAEASLEAALAAVDEVDAQADELGANVRQARAAVRAAEVTLERTRVTLPAEGGPYRVASESVDVGQTVAAGQTVAEVFDAGTLEVPVPLEDDQLDLLRVPGSPATVIVGGSQVAGEAVRTAGEVDPLTQLVEVIVAVEPPGQGAATMLREALVPGRFVEVNFEGRPLEDVIRLPRRAIRRDVDAEGERYLAYVAGPGDLLEIVPVEVVRRTGGDVLVRGLLDGDRVVLSRLDIVTPGMPVQVAGEPATRPADEEAPQ